MARNDDAATEVLLPWKYLGLMFVLGIAYLLIKRGIFESVMMGVGYTSGGIGIMLSVWIMVRRKAILNSSSVILLGWSLFVIALTALIGFITQAV